VRGLLVEELRNHAAAEGEFEQPHHAGILHELFDAVGGRESGQEVHTLAVDHRQFLHAEEFEKVDVADEVSDFGVSVGIYDGLDDLK